MLSALWARFESPAKKRKGGWRQQADEDVGDEESTKISRLCARQLLKWCSGDQSAIAAHETLRDAWDDGFRHPMLQRFALVSGEQNAHRQFMGLIEKLTPTLDLIDVFSAPGSAVSQWLRPSKVVSTFF